MAITDGWVMTAGTDNQPDAVAPDISIVPAGRLDGAAGRAPLLVLTGGLVGAPRSSAVV